MRRGTTSLKKPSGKLAVITCHFNYSNYVAPRANLMRFLRHMELLDVPVYGIELVRENQQPATSGREGWSQLMVGEHELVWQKEALLNKVAAQLPKEIEKVAWVDADLMFDDKDWAHNLDQALDKKKVVQPFQLAFWTNREGKVISQRKSFLSCGLSKSWEGHPGFAMAARREFFELFGLYPWAIVGGGDTALAAAIWSKEPIKLLGGLRKYDGLGLDCEGTKQLYLEWASRVKTWLREDFSWLNCKVYHDWHGDWQDRRYADRCEMMVGLDVKKELTLNFKGLIQWTEDANVERKQQVADYFTTRNEDGL